MSRISRCLMVGVWVLTGFGAARAAEDKIDKMTGDQTTAKYQRKSITYLGISAAPGVAINEDQMGVVAKAIRNGVELKRFDYNEVDLQKIGSIDDLVQQLKGYVKEAGSNRAAAEAEYEARFKSARVYFKDIDRIMNSAYFYDIKVMAFGVSPFVCPTDARQALAMKCTPGASSMQAQVNATVSFYRANLTDDTKPAYSLLKDLSWSPQTGSESYESVPIPPPASAGRAAHDSYRAALAAYNQRLPRLRYDAGLEAAAKASSALAEFLSKELKQMPEFQLLTPVIGALSDGVEFMLGSNEGLGLDDTYEVTEFDVTGTKSLIGYVKVRTVGSATGTGEGTPTYAEKVKEKHRFVGGELLVEHPMVGVSVGVSGIFEVAYRNLIPQHETKLGFYPGVGFYVDKDIANLIKWTETYISIEGDVLFLLKDVNDQGWYLVHGMLGFKKKWYINSFVLSAGLRGGISYYVNGDYSGDKLGGGGDIVFGAEYYIKPEFSVFLKVAGRFFTNPVEETNFKTSDFELGGNASLGLFAAF